ncbi:hypothetical protein BDQ17DRAFT_1234693 [Cyathus striatus]|nr:hypothetical protein BDQ17DRAFT_1234693 [Cyathus striatus]
MSSNGLLFVYGECGPQVTEDEFNDWYNNEHAPARLTVPGFFSATRYKASDSQSPQWLAVYDMESPEIASSEPYKALMGKASDREKTLIPRLSMLNRRIYTLLSTHTHPANKPDTPAKYVLVATTAVPVGLDQEFNKWYEESHLDEIARVPGWCTCRRYRLLNAIELGSNKPATIIHNYVAIHEWDNDSYMDAPEFQASLISPWSTKILGAVSEHQERRFVLHKAFKEPQ